MGTKRATGAAGVHDGHAHVERRPWCDVGRYHGGEAVALLVGNVDLLTREHRVAVERPRHLQQLISVTWFEGHPAGGALVLVEEVDASRGAVDALLPPGRQRRRRWIVDLAASHRHHRVSSWPYELHRHRAVRVLHEGRSGLLHVRALAVDDDRVDLLLELLEEGFDERLRSKVSRYVLSRVRDVYSA